MRRRLQFTGLAVVTIAAITGIGACTASGGGGGSAPAANHAAHGAVGGRAGASATPVPSPPRTAAGSSAGGTSYGGRAGFASVEIGTAKIRIASMTVQVKRDTTVAQQANSAEAITIGAGGEVDADDRSSGPDASATLVLRVPPEQLTATLTQLSKLGDEKSRRLSTQDVTSKVADVNSRVASAQGAIARLRVLYRHARKIADVINIESELAQRESDLESLQAQQRALAAETSTAAITLTLTTPPKIVKKNLPPPVKKHDEGGFLGGLHNGWHAFVTGAKAVATAVGALLPFAVLLLVLGLAARLLWPRIRPTRRTAPTPPQ
ncbi:MAG TPA: DUF4349 domain-containing protein [Jatrophihabitans sp.]|jgi:hypothetical protein